jgi:16S rRNA G966 N2-methylase RsmD
MADNAFDIVFFDPMFRKPLLKSQAISPLRLLANNDPLEKSIIEEACRVAKRRVVMKEMVSSLEFERLGFTKILRSSYNKIGMGVLEV